MRKTVTNFFYAVSLGALFVALSSTSAARNKPQEIDLQLCKSGTFDGFAPYLICRSQERAEFYFVVGGANGGPYRNAAFAVWLNQDSCEVLQQYPQEPSVDSSSGTIVFLPIRGFGTHSGRQANHVLSLGKRSGKTYLTDLATKETEQVLCFEPK